jgi:hypothetical protein
LEEIKRHITKKNIGVIGKGMLWSRCEKHEEEVEKCMDRENNGRKERKLVLVRDRNDIAS